MAAMRRMKKGDIPWNAALFEEMCLYDQWVIILSGPINVFGNHVEIAGT